MWINPEKLAKEYLIQQKKTQKPRHMWYDSNVKKCNDLSGKIVHFVCSGFGQKGFLNFHCHLSSLLIRVYKNGKRVLYTMSNYTFKISVLIRLALCDPLIYIVKSSWTKENVFFLNWTKLLLSSIWMKWKKI